MATIVTATGQERTWTGAERVRGNILDITGGPDPLRKLSRDLLEVQGKSFSIKAELAALSSIKDSAYQIQTYLNRTLFPTITMAIPQEMTDGKESPPLDERKFAVYNAKLEGDILAGFKRIAQHKFKSSDIEVQAKIDLFFEEVNISISQLESEDYYKGKACPAVLIFQIEALNTRLSGGIHEGRRNEDGLLEVLNKKIGDLKENNLVLGALQEKEAALTAQIKALIAAQK